MSAPVEVVVGATDLDATTRFLATFDLEVVAEGTVAVTDADSGDGQAGSTSWRRLGVPGADRGTIRLVATDLPGGPRPAIAAGPLAVDLYTRDLDASLARLADAGIDRGHLGTLDLGPLVMRQCEVIAPDGWRIVLVEANHRRPTTLDDDPDRLHSEVHSVLWTVPSIEEATPALVDLGLTQAHVFPIQHPELARIIDLPAPDTTLVMNLLVDGDQAPIRVELCEFPEHPPAAGDIPHHGDGSPLASGVHALALSTDPTAPTVALPGGIRIQH
jgi:hypothetical protein